MGLHSSIKGKRILALALWGLAILILGGCSKSQPSPVYNGHVKIYRGDGAITAVEVAFPEGQVVYTKEQIMQILEVLYAMELDLEHASGQLQDQMPEQLPIDHPPE